MLLEKFERKDSPVTHELKIGTEYYFEVSSGRKKFEIRKNDRDFRRGDKVELRAFDQEKGVYQKLPTIHAYISYVTDFEQKEGYVVFSISEVRMFNDEGKAMF